MYNGYADETIDPTTPSSRYVPTLLGTLTQMITMDHNMDERPILSIRFGHANMTPTTVRSEGFRNSSLYDTGIHQSLMWIDLAARRDTPRALCDLRGRERDIRFRGMQATDFVTFRQDEWRYREELSEEVAMAREICFSRSPSSFPWEGDHSSDGNPQKGDLTL